MNGILVVDKPEGLTSAAVVRHVKRRLRVRVGHLGTLDPFATGVLPVCVGEATKIAQFLNTADKSYEGLIRLGVATDSGDRTGTVVRTAAIPDFDDHRLRAVERHFLGERLQVPPMHSALKRDGVPLYRLARQGIEVARAARPIRIESLGLARTGPDQLRFEVACSKGTYVRVLAEEIGAALGSAAHLEALRRTRFGRFHVREAIALAAWEPHSAHGLVPIREALAGLPAFEIGRRAAAAARQGQAWVLDEVPPAAAGDAAMLIGPDGAVVAVVVRRGGRWRFARVLQPGPALQPRGPVLDDGAK